MSEQVASPENPTPEATSTGSLGRLLAAAREEKGLQIEDVSKQLRMSLHQIKALESDNFRALPNPMYTRGFIRNYARLLQIDPELLLHMYRNYVPTEAPHAISLPSENIPIFNQGKKSWLSTVIIGVVFVVALGAWLTYMGYAENIPVKVAATQAAPSSHKEGPKQDTANSEPMPMPALPVAEREATDAPVVENSLPAADAGSAQKPAQSATATLKFTFSDHTWVSVTDKDNKEIFNKTRPAGTEDTVQGQPPFKITIGNAAGSALVFNDKPVDLAPFTKLNVAHLTLE